MGPPLGSSSKPRGPGQGGGGTEQDVGMVAGPLGSGAVRPGPDKRVTPSTWDPGNPLPPNAQVCGNMGAERGKASILTRELMSVSSCGHTPASPQTQPVPAPPRTGPGVRGPAGANRLVPGRGRPSFPERHAAGAAPSGSSSQGAETDRGSDAIAGTGCGTGLRGCVSCPRTHPGRGAVSSERAGVLQPCLPWVRRGLMGILMGSHFPWKRVGQ